MTEKIVIIDGNSLINRAYYAMQRPMITKEGIYTQGIFGFMNMLLRIIDDHSPEYMAVAWDRKAPTFRHLSYSDYKAGRRKMPPELAMELPLMKDILSAMSIKNLEIDGFEADDIIGTVARIAESEGLEVLIITGDKDALQLATDNTKILITRKGISDFDLFDREKMLERYELTPEQFIDLKGLMGDSSDNIPGIPGVGEKTGIKLLKQFGSISELLSRTDEIKNAKLRDKVEKNAQLAAMSRKLAEIVTNVPLDIEISDLKVGERDNSHLIDVFTKLEFNSFLKKMDLTDRSAEDAAAPQERTYTRRIIRSASELKPLEDMPEGGKAAIKVFSDFDHVNDPSVYGIALLTGEDLDEYSYIAVDEETTAAVITLLNDKRPALIGHDLVRDYYALLTKGLVYPESSFDTAIAQYVLDPSRSDVSLKVLALEYLHKDMKTEKEAIEDGAQLDLLGSSDDALADFGLECLDAVVTIMPRQKNRLSNDGLTKLFEEVELPLIAVLASMEYEGIDVDREVLADIGKALSEEIENTEKAIFELSGEEFNINSPVQLGTILFEKLGLPSGKKTKRGYSTSADILEKISDKHPVVPLVLRYRTVTKLKSTYIDGLIPLIDGSGRIHAHFRQTVTATGRLSCTEPNLQNIPVRQELGRKIRKAFVAGRDKLLVGADYSQIELRILAHMSQDENLIEAFNKGEDIHRNTASRVFGVPYDEVTSLDRSRAKAVNFGVIYGMSGFGLSEEIHVTRKEAEDFIRDYYDKHPKVKAFMDASVAAAKDRGYSETILGRKRYINEIGSSNYMMRQLGERLAMNSPIQGSAADVIKIAMIAVYKALRKAGLKSKLILQIHDELIIRAEKGEEEAVKELLVREMENAMDLSVNLKCDMNAAYSWYDLK